MATNIRFREGDGATLIAGNTEDEGQVVALPSATAFTDPVKVCLENISDRSMGNVAGFTSLLLRVTQVGSNDGWTMGKIADDPNGTISKPWGAGVDDFALPTGAPTATLGAGSGGGWAAAGGVGEYGGVVTALNATGETIASVEVTFTVGALTEEWLIDWEDVPGAASYNYYRTAVDDAGTYGAYSFVANVAVSQYNDVGAAATVGAPPADNTTGGAAPDYGTPPADLDFDDVDLTIATAPDGLAVGQQWFFYKIVAVPANTLALGNKRRFRLLPIEV
jgi:hypothetical protein